MPIPLYNTDIIPMTSRPTLTVMDDGDYFVILDTSTGKISKILKTNVMTALKITYDNTTSGLTAETVQAALDELVVNLGSSDSAILALSGRLDTLEGTGEGSVVKAIDDAVNPLAEVVDTNRLYSDSQYLDLKAKYEAQQIAINASKAELYTDDPILQYGAVEIIGKGYEADNTPIDVSANVVDGSLALEQKGLTIRNLVKSPSFEDTANWTLTFANRTTDESYDGDYSVRARNSAWTATQEIIGIAGDKYLVAYWAKKSASTFLNRPKLSWGGVSLYSFNNTSDAKPWTLAMAIVTHNGTNNLLTLAPDNANDVNFIYFDAVSVYHMNALGLDHITDTAILSKLLPYVDGTKSVGKMGIQILDADDNVTQTIFLPEVGNRVPNGTADSIKTVVDGWEHSKRVSTPTSVGSGVAVNTTNYPTAKDGGQWVNELTAGGTEIGVVGTDLTTGAGILRFELTTPIVTKYDLPIPTSGKTIHRFVGEEKISLYGTGVTFTENVLSVIKAIKFVAGVMTDITSLATITTNTVTFSGVNATDVVYMKVEHDVDRPLGILEHTPAVSNTASRLAAIEAWIAAQGA